MQELPEERPRESRRGIGDGEHQQRRAGRGRREEERGRRRAEEEVERPRQGRDGPPSPPPLARTAAGRRRRRPRRPAPPLLLPLAPLVLPQQRPESLEVPRVPRLVVHPPRMQHVERERRDREQSESNGIGGHDVRYREDDESRAGVLDSSGQVQAATRRDGGRADHSGAG